MVLRFLIVALLAGCSGGEPKGSAVVSPPRVRIVSLSPALTDTVVALGSAQDLVGISRYCSMPSGMELPRLGGVQDLPLEAVSALRPTLVLSSDSRRGPADGLALARLPVQRFSEGSLKQILEGFETLGAAIGRAEQGQALRQRIVRGLAELAPTSGQARPKVLLVFSSDGHPLRSVWAAGPGGWMGDLLQSVGMVNALQDGPSYAQINAEGLISIAPEVVVELHGEADDSAPPISDRWALLRQIPAVRDGRLHRLVGEALLRPGPRLLELASALAKLR